MSSGCYGARPSSLSGTDTRDYPDAYRKRAAAIRDRKGGTNCSSVRGTKNPLQAGIPALWRVPNWKKQLRLYESMRSRWISRSSRPWHFMHPRSKPAVLRLLH